LFYRSLAEEMLSIQTTDFDESVTDGGSSGLEDQVARSFNARSIKVLLYPTEARQQKMQNERRDEGKDERARPSFDETSLTRPATDDTHYVHYVHV